VSVSGNRFITVLGSNCCKIRAPATHRPSGELGHSNGRVLLPEAAASPRGRRRPVRGGAVTVLDTTPLTRPLAGLHLVGPTLIYAVDRVVHHVPKDGSAVTPPNLRVVFTATAGVVAHSTPQPGSIYVAGRNGAIEAHSPNGDQVKQAPGAAFITSMAFDGANRSLAWTQMAATWEARVEAGANNYTFTTGANPRLATFNAAGDLYWLDDNGVVASG
jgi:hypothetical protein